MLFRGRLLFSLLILVDHLSGLAVALLAAMQPAPPSCTGPICTAIHNTTAFGLSTLWPRPRASDTRSWRAKQLLEQHRAPITFLLCKMIKEHFRLALRKAYYLSCRRTGAEKMKSSLKTKWTICSTKVLAAKKGLSHLRLLHPLLLCCPHPQVVLFLPRANCLHQLDRPSVTKPPRLGRTLLEAPLTRVMFAFTRIGLPQRRVSYSRPSRSSSTLE